MTVFTSHLPKSAVLDYWRFKINEKSPPLFLPHPGEKFKFLFKKLPTIAGFAENIRELVVINFNIN